MDTDSFIIHIKTEDFYKNIANTVEKWFDTCNYDESDQRLLPISENKKKIGFKDELGGKIMEEFIADLMDDNSEKKKAKGTKKCVLRRRLMFND